MSELDLAYRIAHRLDMGAEQLPQGTRERLFKARQKALARQPAFSSLLSLPGFGHLAHDVLLPQLRIAVSVLALTAGVVGSYYWNSMEQVMENSDVDSALLSDEMPPSAYLDRGFDTWLKGSESLAP